MAAGMNLFTALFDTYQRTARLFPGLLMLLPALLALLAWFPYLIIGNIGLSLVTLATSCGLLYTLATIARTKGKRIETKLLAKWGGWPTTILLRHSSQMDRFTRARYHAFLAKSVPIEFPTLEQERQDPARADEVYGSAIKWLLEKARGDKFPMVAKENASYGFRRNLLGLRPLALSLCVLVTLLSVAAIVLQLAPQWSGLTWSQITASQSTGVWAALGVNIFAAVLWATTVSEDWVRQAADQYASALLACCDSLATSSVKSPARQRTPRAPKGTTGEDDT
ncbi:hypothetical protein ACETRX_34680 [Labrys portucalensis]|uniref:DUF4231 domain-containing protein n=1 Tax=Labrys neptuniae TaxID=376174 RepID=A0ABV6ZRJ3_9HYPH